MPYIKPEMRQCVISTPPGQPGFISVKGAIDNEGNLNYAISMLLKAYVAKHGLRSAVLNSLMGVLESAKTEFYRRVVAPYEDIKIKENGDL